MTTTEIKSKLLKLLEEPKYAIAGKRLAQDFRDQKETPLERALWHIEWAMRNPQPNYLKSPALELGHIAANNYDVVALLTIALVLMVAASWKLFTNIISITSRKSKKLNSKKRN